MPERDKMILRDAPSYLGGFSIFFKEKERREAFHADIKKMSAFVGNQFAIYVEEPYEEGVVAGRVTTFLMVGDKSLDVSRQMYDAAKKYCEQFTSNYQGRFEFVDETSRGQESQLAQKTK